MAKKTVSTKERPARGVSVPLRVRFGETDMAGVVYYARYLDYFTEAGHRYLKALGLSIPGLRLYQGAAG